MWRREYAGLLGVAALGGCTDVFDRAGTSGGGDLPPYAAWLDEPALGVVEDTYGFVSADLTPLVTTDETEATLTSRPGLPGPGSRDALVTNPGRAFQSAIVLVGLGLDDVGLSRLVDTRSADRPSDLPAEVATLSDGMVLNGSFDPDAVASDVQEVGLTEEGSVGGFDVFSGETESVVSTVVGAVAVSSDYVVYQSASRDDPEFVDPVESVQRAVRSYRGSGTRLYEADEDVRWLLETAGSGDAVLGVAAESGTVEPDGESSDVVTRLFRGAEGVVQHADVPDGDVTRIEDATAALVYPDADLVDVDRLESIAGQNAADRVVRTDGRRVVIEASYETST